MMRPRSPRTQQTSSARVYNVFPPGSGDGGPVHSAHPAVHRYGEGGVIVSSQPTSSSSRGFMAQHAFGPQRDFDQAYPGDTGFRPAAQRPNVTHERGVSPPPPDERIGQSRQERADSFATVTPPPHDGDLGPVNTGQTPTRQQEWYHAFRPSNFKFDDRTAAPLVITSPLTALAAVAILI